MAALVEGARAHLGQIDAWFANAGVVRGRGLEASEDEWASSWEINTMAHVRAARLLVPEWLERGGGRFVVDRVRGRAAHGARQRDVLGHQARCGRVRGVALGDVPAPRHRRAGDLPAGRADRHAGQQRRDEGAARRDGALTPEDVAEATWQAMQTDRFLVLPHPEVAGYYAARATESDRWLDGMNKLQQRLEQAEVQA